MEAMPGKRGSRIGLGFPSFRGLVEAVPGCVVHALDPKHVAGAGTALIKGLRFVLWSSVDTVAVGTSQGKGILAGYGVGLRIWVMLA